MAIQEFERKRKEDRPVIAICYDFDKTLSPDDMQAQGYIQSVGYNAADFWKESNGLAEQNDMDQNLAYMYMMIDKAQGLVLFTRKTLEEYGARVRLFPGVEDWFGRIQRYGESHGVIVEHYIISSGLKEMIEGTSVAKNGAFQKIYASSFYYDSHGVAKWPAQVVNYTNKTQFLFRIEKGVLDVNDSGVNDYFPPEDIRVPFRNMIYIGDSDTDIPCMKLVNINGGHSIGVYNAGTKDKAKVYKMMRDQRIKYFAPADYSDGTELDILVKKIIDRTVANEALETIHYQCKREHTDADRLSSREAQEKADLVSALETSPNFTMTHAIIRNLRNFKQWTPEEKEALLAAAVDNSQVFYILGDYDVKKFYTELLAGMHPLTEAAQTVQDAIQRSETS